ncbi:MULTISPECIES: serine/threonine-protein kinase [Microbacterium]|uniref:non-specific serine/threonine protein kinase n=1 Tax=Microbacterium trichothecenolyticum TaxID=69370 RepID=A0A0M2HFQ7_MICTR|nr:MULTISPECIES: serine/threonine-protein kinase [Microbacterium]KJL43104.1 Serine/threonine-protein kinase PK-1 [Microbacterium trichothecenolyticum]MDR7190431.1 tRNA A-37 threonylcarbamoyl transferase component Bud32 [Microbacterium sp. BE35]
MTDLLASGEIATGELLDGRYLLRERIGEGGMARVYRADDTHLQRAVAVKVFREPTDAIGSVERALSETTLLASLSHHSLVTVFDARVGTDESSYLVMELVDGITLRDLIARGPVDPRVVASIAIDIAEGLHVAHDHGVVHRDIKPSNVLLWSSPRPGWEWRAKLADFGIAYLMDSARVTTPGVIVGTMAYVAPEQARGVAPAPPADIYAFGLLLIEALTGERPFGEAEGIGTVMARLSAAPRIPESLHPAWQGLLRGMTAIRPDDRPTALEIVATASRLAAMENTIARENADPSTAPIATIATGPTQVFPQPAPASPPVAPGALRRDARMSVARLRIAEGTDAAAPAPVLPTVRDDERRPSRRTLLIGAVLAALLAIGIALGTLWLANSWAAEPEPAPTSPVEQVSPAPTENAPVEEAPANAPAEEVTPDVAPPADTGGGGSDNSGPGNNNGNGNGNGNGSGPGSNSGNGNGNGNR